jgi:hypothetical protein
MGSGAREKPHCVTAADPHVVFVPLEMGPEPDLDADLRAAGCRSDRTPALRWVLERLFSRDADTDGAPRS